MNEKLIKKIEKLLNLGNGSSFEGEAENALKRAYTLMQENNVSLEDVHKVSRDEKLGHLGKGKISEKEKQWRKWEILLMTSLARLFDCQVIQASGYGKKSTMWVVGRESNRITTTLMYEWIAQKTSKESKKLGTPSARNAYCTGVVHSISKKVKTLKTTTPTGQGLIPVNEVSQWLKENIECTNRKLTASQVKDAMAYTSGRKVGDGISLNRQFGLSSIEHKGV